MLLEDVLLMEVASLEEDGDLHEKDPHQDAFVLSADADTIVKVTGDALIRVPLTNLVLGDPRIPETMSFLIQTSVKSKPVKSVSSLEEATSWMSKRMEAHDMKLHSILISSGTGPWPNARTIESISIPRNIAYGLTDPESLGRLMVGVDKRVGMFVFNPQGVIPIELALN